MEIGIKRRGSGSTPSTQKKLNFQSRPLLVVYSNIPEVQFPFQVSRQLSVKLHLWRHFYNRLTLSWDLGMLRQRPYVLVIENVGRFYRTAHAWYYVTHNDWRYLRQTKFNLWKIITTAPVVVQTWSSAHFLRCQIIYMSIFLIFFDSLKGVYWKEIFWTIVTTVPAIVYTLSGAYFVRCQIL